jgi:hypothetical protein
MNRDEQEEGLIESQGVNAERPVDDEEAQEHNRLEAHPPPDGLTLSGAPTDEMVGLPEQRPGYPGQQRSIDTS